jgi:hypothetical protein
MPNLEIHYKLGLEKRMDFCILGEKCQIALAKAYNEANSAKIAPISVLVRFIPYSEYDCGIPDICFVIKCGNNGFSRKDQLALCSSFDGCEINDMCVLAGLIHDVEIFNYESHGFRTGLEGFTEFHF